MTDSDINTGIDLEAFVREEVEPALSSPADERFRAAVEALLFATHEPLSAATLCATNGHAGWSLDNVIDEINRRYEDGGHPMRVRKVAGGYQMHLLPDFAPIVEAHLVKTKTQRLSRAGLETLAIIAYRQPCTTPEVERVRGVACDGVLRTLLERNLITIRGRSDAPPGRPLLYVTTKDFLHYFGLTTLDELPGEDQLQELLAARTPQEGDPLAAYAASGVQDNLFGRIAITRGSEPDSPGFAIMGVAHSPESNAWTVEAQPVIPAILSAAAPQGVDIEAEGNGQGEAVVADEAEPVAAAESPSPVPVE